MGISGLLPFLKSVTYPIHISEYRGLTAGVDAYCWLHRGAFSCGTELCTGVATDKYVGFCMKRVNLLLEHGVEPIMVFDGASLPIKQDKNLERRRQRESARSKGEAALAAGEAGAAAQHFSKAVGVTHDMAFQFIKALRQAGVELIVAPYEADAQLAFLSRSGAVDVVISEDSDCLPYGCKKVLFKMDNEGHGQEVQLRNLAANTPLSLSNWKNSMFLDLCLLVGCDYISTSVKGLGIATAHKLVERHRSLDKIITAVNSSKFFVPEGYWAEYKRARLTFRHHIIYNPQTETTMHLMPLGDTAKDLDNLDFLGVHLQPSVAQGVGSGHLLPTTHQPYEPERRLDHRLPCRPQPSSGAKTNVPPPDDAATNPVDQAASEASGVCKGTGWDKGEDGGARGDAGPPVQSPLSRAFIDRPFCTSRPALKELSSKGHDGADCLQEPAGWGAAPNETGIGWAAQHNRSMGVSGSHLRDEGGWECRFQTEGDSDRIFAPGAAFPAHSGMAETGQGRGLDLTRIPEAEPRAVHVGLSTAVPSTTLDPSLRTFAGGMSSFHAAEEDAWGPGSHVHGEEGHRHGACTHSLPVDRESHSREGGHATALLGSPQRTNDAQGTSWMGEGQTDREMRRPPGWRQTYSGAGGADVRHTNEAGVRQSDGALGLTSEPPDADHAKWVPVAAQHFHSTQVGHGLETLQRRKRRLEQGGDPDWPELPERAQQPKMQPHHAHEEGGDNPSGSDGGAGSSEGMWMVQPTPESPGSRYRPASRELEEHEVVSARLMITSRDEGSESRVLTASSRRWTLPSTIPPPGNMEGLPLLRLLDGMGERSGHGRKGDPRSSRPLPTSMPKRVRGTDFWDAQLLH